MQPLPLWPVMFYDFDWDDHAKHHNSLKEICRTLEKQNLHSNVARQAKKSLYESRFDFLEYDHDSVRALGNFIKSSVFKAAQHANAEYWKPGMNISVNVHESWCHITRDGGYHDMHTHPNSSWSCIFYLDTADMDNETKNGVNRFYNPFNNMYLDAGTAWNTANNSIDLRAENGQMVVFPSWVQHSALTYRGQRERYVIAANARVEVVG